MYQQAKIFQFLKEIYVFIIDQFSFLSVPKNEGKWWKIVGGGTIWNNITLEEKVDTIITLLTNWANGPFIYHYDRKDAFPTETDDK